MYIMYIYIYIYIYIYRILCIEKKTANKVAMGQSNDSAHINFSTYGVMQRCSLLESIT